MAIIVSRFPKITETFILYEILALERLGLSVELYALHRERQPISHAEAIAMTKRTHFAPVLSAEIVRTNVRVLARRPAVYIRTIAEVLAGTFGSTRMFLGALATLPMAFFFAERMRRQRITHVHAHFATHPTVAALIIHRVTGIPFSFMAHGSDLHVDRRMLDKKLDAAAFAVTCSDFNRKVMADVSSRSANKIHVIKYGVDLDLFYPTESRDDDDIQMVCVASFEEVKGHRFLLEACQALAQRGVAFTLHLVGDGPLRHEIEQQAISRGLAQRIAFHGLLDRVRVAERLRAADIKVLASYPSPDGRKEGMPNVLIEAMAAGLPVVSTELTGIPELVESGVSGILVPPADSMALADALFKLCQDATLRERMGKAGRAKAIAEFDRTTNASHLARLLGLRA